MMDIAQSFHNVATQLGEIRLHAIGRGHKLTDENIVRLEKKVYLIMSAAANFALQQANLSISDPVSAVSAITSAMSKATTALKNLTDLEKADSIGSSVIVLSMAISTKDITHIRSTARSVSLAASK
jgi:hypothetical protein